MILCFVWIRLSIAKYSLFLTGSMLLSMEVSLQSKLLYLFAFFIKYSRVMKSLCQSLDILQSEEKTYFGILLPTVVVCAKKLTDIQQVGDLAVRKLLLSSILNGLKKRFQPCVESIDCLLSPAFYPHFFLIGTVVPI